MMKTYPLTVKLLSYWHAGSGHGAKADADALVLRDREGFPYLPGRTLKGLLRDALLDMGNPDLADEILGKAAKTGENSGSTAGVLAFDDARMATNDSDWIRQSPDPEGLKAQLFDTIASTSIDANGVASEKTLRMVEVALPMELTGAVSYLGLPEEETATMESVFEACGLIRAIGAHRHRGLGRCQVRLTLQS
jgi:hypothetical protein